MADPRLQWRQLATAQPNVSGLMSNARQGINDAAAAAGDILGKYDEGQKSAGDQELARLLASATNQDDLNALVNSDAVKGLRLSEEGVGMLNAAQGNRVDWMNTRDTVRSRGVRDGIAVNADNRLQGDWDWNDGRRRELAGLSGDVVGARTEGQDFGENGRPIGDRMTNYLETTIGSESSGDPNARNPKSSATGLAQFTDGTWAQMMAKHPDLNLTEDGRTDPAQARRALARFTEDNAQFLRSNNIPVTEGTLYASHFLGSGGARAVAQADPNERMINVASSEQVEANPFLQNMSVAEFREWATEKGGGGGSRTPARDQLEGSLAGSQYLSPGDVTGLLNDNDTRVGQGDAAIAADLAAQNEAMIAQLTMDAMSDPNVTTPAQVQQQVAQRAEASGMSSSEVLQAQRAAEDIIAGSAGMQTQLSPAVAEDVRFTNIVEGANADINTALDSTVMGRMTQDVQTFSEAGNPTEALMDTLGSTLQDNAAGPIGAFFSEGGAGADKNDVTNMINRYAAKFKVSPEVAAAAMREAFVDDPTTFIGNANTLENRFDEDRVGEIISEYTNQENQSQFGDRTRGRREVAQRLETLNDSVVDLQRRAAKTTDPRERQAISQQIADIYTEMSTMRTEAQELYRGN